MKNTEEWFQADNLDLADTLRNIAIHVDDGDSLTVAILSDLDDDRVEIIAYAQYEGTMYVIRDDEGKIDTLVDSHGGGYDWYTAGDWAGVVVDELAHLPEALHDLLIEIEPDVKADLAAAQVAEEDASKCHESK